MLPVLVRLSNPKNRIKAGISGFARLRITKQALVVPAQAILQQGSKSIVFRVENGRARARTVQTGQVVENGVVEIQSGLVRGDEVVIYFSNIYKNTGNLTKRNCYLQDGDPVDVDWPKWTGRSEG